MYMLCRYFFFFKQKTAYEMRISDWSSDVCSSDLEHTVAANALDHDEMLETLEIHQHDGRTLHQFQLVDGDPETFGAKAARGEIGLHVEHREDRKSVV